MQTSRALLYRVLAKLDAMEAGGGGRGEPHKVCIHIVLLCVCRFHAFVQLAAAAFLHAAEAATYACDSGVQIFGGAGYMRDMEINRLYRSCKVRVCCCYFDSSV